MTTQEDLQKIMVQVMGSIKDEQNLNPADELEQNNQKVN